MARSLQEQLLKSGLATESSLKKARENNNKNSDEAKNKSSKPQSAYKNKTSRRSLNSSYQPKNQREQNNEGTQEKSSDAQSPHHAQKNSPHSTNTAQPTRKTHKKPKAKNNEPNLANLYRQRAEVERKEKEDEEARRREQARIKKQTRKKLRTLVLKHLQNDDQASLRYNFVVGSNVKYVFVTEEQQNQLAAGELAITFIDGKR
ncbi:MAG TPA: DUF2058 family protein, partial [Thiothrix sp.]|nr:DUF2058 family protein [Thiothrix sp.]